MGEIFEYFKNKKKKENWNAPHEELFSVLSIDNVNDSIRPYIELLKTSDFRGVLSKFKKGKGDFQEKMEESFKEFIDYLLEGERYKDFFKQSMDRYIVKGDDNGIFKRVYDDTLDELRYGLDCIKTGKSTIHPFLVSQVIKLLRGEAFVFKSGKGMVWFEKDYLYGDDARKINKINGDDVDNKPVYGLRMHVGEGASIYGGLKPILDNLRAFYESTDLGVVPYVGMKSWLLDSNFLKYRLGKKGRKPEIIEKFMSKNESVLGKISLNKISKKSDYKKVSKRIKNHLGEDEKMLVESYEADGNELMEGSCLFPLYTE